MNQEKKEKIVIVGYGWVGQANAIALTKMGYEVFFFDTASEPRLHYAEEESDVYEQVQRAASIQEVDSESTWFMVCVGDRVGEDREQDISLIKKATDSLKNIRGRVLLRSTVLPQKLSDLAFDAYIPEFLHEKNAVDECINPFYFVIGTRAEITLPSFIKDWERRSHRVFKGTPEEASYVKYLSNIWNSIRIAFTNEMGDSIRTPETKEDVKTIERVLDFVLGRKMYLKYGQAFDGHCLPKDTRAFIGAHQKEGKNVDLLVGAYTSNEHHKILQERYKSLPKIFSFWEYDSVDSTALGFFWQKLNEVPLVKTARRNSRFLVDGVSQYIPDRSVAEAINIWEQNAQKNPLYYSDTRAKSGFKVTEAELRESGEADYELYVASDPHIREIRNKESLTSVLDFGSGVGRMTEFFGNDFEKVYGVDVSPTMIEHARNRIAKGNVSLEVFDGALLSYDSDSFDLIFSYMVLQYVPTQSKVEEYLKDFYRVLKKDGSAKLQLRGGRGVKKWEWSYGVSFTPEEAVLLAERLGFTVLDHQVEGIKHIWLTLQK